MNPDTITLNSAITWVMTTLIYAFLKKWKAYNPNYPIPFSGKKLGDFIGSMIAIASGVVVTYIGYYMGSVQTDFVTANKEALMAIISAVGFHGLIGTHIATSFENHLNFPIE